MKVEIYTKADCQFCDTAKKVVTRREWPLDVKSIEEEANMAEIIARLGHAPRSVPQIFINGEFVGGCDIVTDLYVSGELKKMVEAAKQFLQNLNVGGELDTLNP